MVGRLSQWVRVTMTLDSVDPSGPAVDSIEALGRPWKKAQRQKELADVLMQASLGFCTPVLAGGKLGIRHCQVA